MKISGFTFIRNGVKFDYPFIESIKSLLPLCDELIIAAGNSEDDTVQRIESLNSSKVIIIPTVWDESLRKGGAVLAGQTNKALDQVSGDWAIYLQADEVLHEKDYDSIISSMNKYRHSREVEGFLFGYKHFYGSYHYTGDSRRWYRHEIRIVRPVKGLRSWGDAQGFRIEGRKLQVRKIDASIYHYGWVKRPCTQQMKQKYFNRLWHPDKWIEQNVGIKSEYDYNRYGRLKMFDGPHPAVMRDRAANQDWVFSYDESKVNRTVREVILEGIEDITGWRVGEYRNYTLI
jgi:hypothetical protein